jgi:hypothetical protein
MGKSSEGVGRDLEGAKVVMMQFTLSVLGKWAAIVVLLACLPAFDPNGFAELPVASHGRKPRAAEHSSRGWTFLSLHVFQCGVRCAHVCCLAMSVRKQRKPAYPVCAPSENDRLQEDVIGVSFLRCDRERQVAYGGRQAVHAQGQAWWHCGLNSGPHTCYQALLLLGLFHLPFFVMDFF